MNKLIVSPSPHFLSHNSTSKIMLDVVVALIPAFLVSIVFFGISTLSVTVTCVVSCVAFEYIVRKIMNRSNTIFDLSAVVTGMILAFNLPSTIPIWICVIGSFFAIVIVKQLFGGIGQNFANPAATARIILFVSFSTQMTTWAQPFSYRSGADIIASATPLANINAANTLDLFIGKTGGSIGEVSAIALIIGGIYLVIRRVINPFVPLSFIGTVFVMSWILGDNPVNHIFAGGLMLGAIFMATDYSTTPQAIKGRIIFAICCGVITVAIRMYGSYPDGVSFAILLMNLFTPLIDRATTTRAFGTVKTKTRKEGKSVKNV